MTDTDTPPTGPAAAKTAEQFASEWLDRGHSVAKRSVLVAIIEAAMAQAHAAGREEQNAADAEAARSMAESLSGWATPERVGERVAGAVRDALRTAITQPTATEASERDG